MRQMAWCLAAVAGVILTTGVVHGGGGQKAAGGKPAPAPTYSPWTCTVTLRDAEGDMVRSDGKGPYVNGVGGLHCGILADPSATKYGWLEVTFDSTSARYILYPGQSQDVDGGPGYNTLNSRGTFEVKGLSKNVVFNPSDPDHFDVVPFRANQTDRSFANKMGQFGGDSNFTGEPWSIGSSSPFVQALAEPPGSVAASCSWKIWLDPSAERISVSLGESAVTRAGTQAAPYGPRVLEIREGVAYGQSRGLYVMPFQATVRITGGGGTAGVNLPYAGCR